MVRLGVAGRGVVGLGMARCGKATVVLEVPILTIKTRSKITPAPD